MPPRSKRATGTELHQFFAYKPKALTPGPNHTPSPNTRGPQVFDLHLVDDMILKHVVVVPKMVDDFMQIAQASLDSAKVPPLTDAVHTLDNHPELDELLEGSSLFINKECDIQEYYDQTIGPFCSRVAGILAFELDDWRDEVLEWKIKHSDRSNEDEVDFPTGFGTRALADGFLLATGYGAAYVEDLSLISRFFSTILLFEFKNLNFANPKDMQNILKTSLSKTFKWTRCKLKDKCFTTHGSNVNGGRLGPDAPRSQLPSVQRLVDNPSLNEPFQPSTSAKSKAKRTRSPRTKAHAESNNPADDLDVGVPQSSYHVLQQVWTELSDNDATYAVINAGNKELVCERNREKQTLYISDYIDVTEVFYFKLHTGIFLAAIFDALARAKLLKVSIPPKWERSFDILVDFRYASEQVLPDLVLREFQSRPWLMLRADDGPGAPAGPLFQDVLYLSGSTETTVANSETAEPATDKSLAIATIQSSDRYSKGCHSKAMISFKKWALPRGVNSEPATTVFLKTAQGLEALESLRREFAIYQELHAQGVTGIPRVYGFYEYHSSSRGPFGALALEYLGRSARRYLADPDSPTSSIEVTRREVFRGILTQILSAGYAFHTLRADDFLIFGQSPSSSAVAGIDGLRLVKDASSYPKGYFEALRSDIVKLFPNALSRQRAIDDEPTESTIVESGSETPPNKRPRLTIPARDGRTTGLPQSLRRAVSLPWDSLDGVEIKY